MVVNVNNTAVGSLAVNQFLGCHRCLSVRGHVHFMWHQFGFDVHSIGSCHSVKIDMTTGPSGT